MLQRKSQKAQRKNLKTVLQSPFEYQLQSLNTQASLHVVNTIYQSTTDPTHKESLKLYFGIRSAVRKIKHQKDKVLAVVLILDKNLHELIIEAATMFKILDQPFLLLEESVKSNLQQLFKVKKINCLTLLAQDGSHEELKKELECYLQESKAKIPLAFPDSSYKKLKVQDQ